MGYRKKTLPAKLRPYDPLLTYGLIAAGLQLIIWLVKRTMCAMLNVAVKGAACGFTLPWPIEELSMVLLAIGAIGTLWNLWVRKDKRPELER